MSKKKSYRSRIAANGQVVIPKELRDALHLKGGDAILFDAEEVEGIVRVAIRKPWVSFSSLIGTLKHLSGKTYDVILKNLDEEEMN